MPATPSVRRPFTAGSRMLFLCLWKLDRSKFSDGEHSNSWLQDDGQGRSRVYGETGSSGEDWK